MSNPWELAALIPQVPHIPQLQPFHESSFGIQQGVDPCRRFLEIFHAQLILLVALVVCDVVVPGMQHFTLKSGWKEQDVRIIILSIWQYIIPVQVLSIYYPYTTAEPLEKNRIRILQPTLGFLNQVLKR